MPINDKKLDRGMKRLGLSAGAHPTPKSISRFHYELKEVYRSCRTLPRDIQEVVELVEEFDDTKVEELHEAAISAAGGIVHIRYHLQYVMRRIEQISQKTRTMPPLSKVGDCEYSERVIKRFWEEFGKDKGQGKTLVRKNVKRKRRAQRRRSHR